jgi:hypothetical protein
MPADRKRVDTTSRLYDAWPVITVRLVPFATGRAREWLRVPYDVEEFSRRRENLTAAGRVAVRGGGALEGC